MSINGLHKPTITGLWSDWYALEAEDAKNLFMVKFDIINIIVVMSFKKVWIFTKRFFERSTQLSAIINKSRLFNTYESLYEMVCIIFYNAIASRLNQKALVYSNTLVAFISILGQLFIHVSPRELYYKNSIIVNFTCEGLLVY